MWNATGSGMVSCEAASHRGGIAKRSTGTGFEGARPCARGVGEGVRMAALTPPGSAGVCVP
eukprot:1659411-Prymnesium_polylepis.3